MKKISYLLVVILSANTIFSQGRIQYNDQELFLSGANLAWLSYANDVGSGSTGFEQFGEILLDIHEYGGNSLRWWLHTNGTNSPEFGSQDFVIGPGEYTISDIRTVLDLAWEREVGLKLCLWSFDMLRTNLNIQARDRNLLLLTDTTYTNAYINNALIPMVESLKGHPAIIAWEIFNEPEGMSDEFGWSEIEHVPMSDIQRFINLTAGAIHRTDTSAQVTSGCWSMQAMTDVSTASLSKLVAAQSQFELENIAEFINSKYDFALTVDQVFDHLSKIAKIENQNYYSDAALIASGGDTAGTLDFYSVHYYDWAGTPLSPFHNTSNFWQLDKPIVIAEFHMKNTLGVLKEDLYKILFQTGYAGALAWSWTDNDVTQPIDMLEGMKYLWDNHRTSVDVLGIGGDWPTVSILNPLDKAEFADTSDIFIEVEANDQDGSIVSIELFVNDTLKIGEIADTPYVFTWTNVTAGNYTLHAVATDNEGHQRKSNIVRIIYGEPPFQRYEAEAITIPTSGISILNDPTASGGNYVEFRTNTGSITWRITNYLGAGTYEIIFGYRLSFDSPKSQFININGSRVTELEFSGVQNKWLEKSLMVDLIEGENTIEMELSWGWMDVDYLAVPRNVITALESTIILPLTYMLNQNFPNPFNPSTKIQYTIANTEKVRLVVYDILGRTVATLVNDIQLKGQYEIPFFANGLSSGIYFYSLETESFTKKKKMLLLK